MPDAFEVKGIIDLLAPYFKQGDTFLAADHDIIYFPCREADLSPEVLKKLEELHAHFDESAGSWAAFV